VDYREAKILANVPAGKYHLAVRLCLTAKGQRFSIRREDGQLLPNGQIVQGLVQVGP